MLIPIGSAEVMDSWSRLQSKKWLINTGKREERVYLHLKDGGIFRPEASLGVNTNWQAIDSFHGCEQQTVSIISRAKQQRWLWMWSRTAPRWGRDGLSSHISNLKDFSISAKFISACERWKKSALASRNVCDIHEFGLWQTTGESVLSTIPAGRTVLQVLKWHSS